jgi:hypothetical protein
LGICPAGFDGDRWTSVALRTTEGCDGWAADLTELGCEVGCVGTGNDLFG